MAKDRFIRSKPHVNVFMVPRLIQRGFTPNGAYQIAQGLIVTDPNDRQLIAETLAESAQMHYYAIRISEGR